MFISDIYDNKKCVVSLEVFPPKKQGGMEAITEVMEQICQLDADYISVTCGAGGSQGDNTLGLASMIKNKFQVEAMAHMTCITSTKAEMEQKVKGFKENNISNILALRGDTPKDGREIASDYHFAKDLITDLDSLGFCVAATCYPEGHISCHDLESNIEHTLQKEQAGAKFLISQLFFDNRPFYDFLDMASKKGISIPISAGIMPMMSEQQVKNMIFMCGASLPSEMVKLLYRFQGDPESLLEAGMEYAQKQIEDLRHHRVEGIHIYTMNRPQIAKRLIEVAKN